MKTNKKQTVWSKVSRFAGLFLVLGIILGFASQSAYAQMPPANTAIGNQASATYLDNGGNNQSITSNTVETIVQQVAGVDITQGISLTVSPGGQVSFPHTITNLGNGVDSFDLTILEGTGAFDFDNIVIYADEDGNGVPDNFTPITTTPNIDPAGTPNGNTYGIVIVADVPVTATDSDVETIVVTATSSFDSNESDSGTNTTTVDEDAVVNVQKNRDKQFVDVGDTVTYTFAYAESGGSANASNLVIKDPLPTGVTYVPGSGKWSGASGIALTDASGETATGITYEFITGGVADSVIVTIANINAGASGTVSFKVEVDAGTYGQTIVNNGTFKHDDAPTPVNTNNATIQVNDNYDIESVGADTVSAGPVDQGDIVNFLNLFTNEGTATDTYNITYSGSNYPSGTTFTFYKVDANNQPTSPFTDTNSDNIIDSGPIAVGDTVKVILQVNLPSGASGGPYSVVKTLTSVNDPNESDFHVDKLVGINQPTVDITNGGEIGSGNETGVGDGPEASPVTTIPANPGTTVNFTLYINNTSAQDDNYALAFATDTTAGGDLQNAGVLPSGWTASFRDPNNGNSVITSTGNITAGSFKQVTFRVNIPAGYQPGTVDLYVRALSQTSTAIDLKHEAVSVNTVRSIALVANQTAQVSPGGSVDYIHTLTVNSNVDENTTSSSNLFINLTNSTPTGWTSVVYWDVDEDGQVTGADSLLTSGASPSAVDLPTGIGALSYGDQVKFIVQVTASTGLNDGATLTTTIAINDDNTQIAAVSNDDQTEVQAGRLSIDKFQAPDNGGAPGTFTKNNFNVFPGDTVWYKIVVVNDGSEPVTNVIVQDNVPSYTTIAAVATVTEDIGTITGLALDGGNPTVGNTGVVKVVATSLDPTEQFTILFAVKVDE
mgnify:CR=1 FL=1|tara:strand:+ start:66436 stop:69108 length:2673 start_codon:yes stop_codon:yes gene_type:complete